MLFYSNVFSLMDWSINGVNPCTLMYVQNIKLAHVVANNVQGPNFELYLRFNQFNNKNYGFGTGWELSLSRVDEETDSAGNAIKTLVLPDGSRYRIDNETETTVELEYKKANTFKLLKNEEGYQVIYKNGLIESIEDGRVVKLKGANGKGLSITWKDDDTFSMKDDDGIIVLYTSMVASTIAGEKNHLVYTSRGNFSCQLKMLSEDLFMLRSVKEQGTASEIYQVRYEIHNEDYLAINFFSSLIEHQIKDHVVYGMMQVPEDFDGDALAVVSVRTYLSGAQGNELYQEYTYGFGASNYLGFGVVSKWNNDVDNLEGLTASMIFTSKETVNKKDEKIDVARTTTRTYNKFYLLTITDWEPKPEKRFKSEHYVYLVSLGGGIDAQCASFMLPVQKIERVTVKSDAAAAVNIDRVYTFAYDDYANVTQQVGADGLVEKYTYYDGGAGESGNCPPDPNGFVNYIKTKTVSSYKTLYGDKTRTWNYTYKQITGTNLVLMTQEDFSVFQTVNPSPPAIALSQKKYTYEEADPVFIGELRSVVSGKSTATENEPDAGAPRFLYTTISFQDSIASYKSRKSRKRIRTVSGFDGNKISSTIFQDCVTGDIVCMEDENDVSNDYSYDSLGRETGTVREAPTGEIIEEKVTYYPSVSEIVTKKSTDKFSMARKYDGLGNIVKEELLVAASDPKKPPVRYVMMSSSYNNLDQLVKSETYDYLLEDSSGATLKKYVKETACEWNIYDEITKEVHADKSLDRYRYDESVSKVFTHTVTVDHEPGSVRKTLCYDRHGLLVQRQTRSPVDARYADVTEQFGYDNFLRLISSSETNREIIRYDYDDFDRQITQAGIESGRKITDYAAHSTQKLVSKISIDGTVVGEKKHDGLDREILTTVSGISTVYNYAGSAIYTRPSSSAVDGGRYIQYEYDVLFDKVVSRKTRWNEPGANWLTVRNFTYDPDSGLLSSAKNTIQNGKNGKPYFEFRQDFSYTSFGTLKEETGEWIIPGNRKYSHTHTATIRGLQVKAVIKPGSATTMSRINDFDTSGQLISVRFLYNETELTASTIARNQYGDISMIEHGCYLYDRQPFSATIKPLVHKRHYHARYNTISSVSFFHQYEISKAEKKIKKQDQIMESLFEYNEHHSLVRLKNKFFAANTFAWSEKYRYTRLGQLQHWNRVGGIVFHDEFGNKISSQRFAMDKLSNITKVTAELESVSNEAAYTYDNDFQLQRIENKNAWASLAVPKTIDFKYAGEGKLITKTYVLEGKTVTENYSYAGEDNISQILQTITPGKEEHRRNYFYDAHGNVASSLLTGPADTVSSLNYYYDGNIFFSVNTSRKTPDQSSYTLYHRIENEVMFITHIDAEGEIKVCPCLGLPNGNLIARGRPSLSYRYDRRHNGQNTYTVKYIFNISGQNAYGMTFDLNVDIPFLMKGL